jgi:pimeloyl-ACP methyl ester carboxylesterase
VTPFAPWPADPVVVTRRGRPVELSVRTTPDGPGRTPALMVHGLGGSALNWTDLMGLLADRLASRAPDLPGFGLSPPPADHDYSLTAHAQAVTGLLEHDSRAPVHLMGNSLGGAVATMVAAHRPDLVRSLTLISPALPDFRPGRYRTQVALLAAPGIGALLSRRLAALSPEQRVAGLLRLVYADPSAVDDRQRAMAVEEVARRSRLPYATDALGSSARGLMHEFVRTGTGSLWRLAAQVTVPTLLLYGRQDRLVSHLVAPKAKAAFPHATVVVLPRSGHVAQMEQPEVVEQLVRRLLDQA